MDMIGDEPAETLAAVLPVSVVIPCYNRAHLVGDAVRSALEQYPMGPAEVIVVDDGSTDDSADVARRAGAQVIGQPNGGEAAARNTGLRAAENDWVALLDSDDFWLPWHLATLWPHRDGHVLVGSVARVLPSGRTIGNRRRETTVLRNPADLFWPDNPVLPSTTLVHRPSVLAAGGFPNLPLAADIAMWSRLLAHGSGIVVPDITCHYREHSGQVTVDTDGMAATLRELLADAGGEAWCTRRLVRRVETRIHWDRLRTAQRAGDLAALWHEARWLSAGPPRWDALWRLLRFRARVRSVTPATDLA